MPPRIWTATALLSALVALSAAMPAGSTTHGRTDFSLTFSSQGRDTPTAMHIHLLYKAAGDPNAKPSPISSLRLQLPRGAVLDGSARARCTASDDELMAIGPSACPADSRVGSGTLSVMTGFGPPLDPYTGDATLFNTPGGVVEVVTQKGTDRAVGTDRLHIRGTRVTATPPVLPGGPPDGRIAVREINFTFDAPSGGRRPYVKTPRRCPRTRRWTSTGAFRFADGVRDAETAVTTCRRRARRAW
jgi:hypothetical protein